MRALLIVFMLSWPALTLGQAAPMTPQPDGGSRPVPDPTILTTQAHEKAIEALRELFDNKATALTDELRRQKETLDRTDTRLIQRLDGLPSMIDISLTHLQRLIEEKFKGVDQQFAGRDTALAAALLAQKTSVTEQQNANAASAAKTESATAKLIQSIVDNNIVNAKATDDKIAGVVALLNSQSKSLDDKITEIRNTVIDLRSTIRVNETAVATRGSAQADLWGYIVGGVGVLLAIMAFVIKSGLAARAVAEPFYYAQPQPQPQPQPQVSVVPVVPVPVPRT